MLATMFLAPALAAAACTGPVRSVAVGDPLRAELLDALRATAEEDLGQQVKFVVRKLRTCGDFAFVLAVPQTPGGEPIDFERTRHAERIAEGAFDGPDTFALLRRAAGIWGTSDYAVGPTDVVWIDWQQRFALPGALFE